MFGFKRTNKKSKKSAKKTNGQTSKQLGIEALEPRILLSATWTDGDTGDPIAGPTEGADVFTGDNAADIADGLGGDDVMFGGGGKDTLSGSAGNDTIDGGNHDDTLSGGDGDDTLSGGNHDDTLSGGDGNDVLDGGSHNDTLDGGAGDDILIGGQGNDSLDGGTGTDTADYSNSTGGVNVDLTSGTATGDGNDTLTNIENVTGSNQNDTLTGDGEDNVLNGGAGDDTLQGGTGDDTLDGGDGDDTLQGGDGDDQLDAGDGTDTADYSDASAAVTVDLNAGTASGGAGNDTLTDIENVTGSSHDDTLIDDAGDNVIDAGAGDDTIHYSGGNDTIMGQDGNDTIIIHSGRNGDVVNVDGGSGVNKIDVSAFDANDVNDDGSTLSVNLGNNESFTIHYTNIDSIEMANASPPPPPNLGPDAVDDSYNTTEDNAVTTGNVLGNDTDPENDALSITGFTQGANGTVVNNNDGTFTYTPDADFAGTDSFTYTVDDGNGGTDTATVTVNVAAQNDGPDAVDDSYNTTEDNAVTTGNVLGNDTDPENDALTITGFTQGANGTVVNNNDGTFTYTPDADFAGTDSFTYTVDDGNGGTDTATVTVNVAADPANNTPAGGQGPQPSPVSPVSVDPDDVSGPQVDVDPHDPTEEHNPLAGGDEPGFDAFAPGPLDEVETITLESESESNVEDLVQANNVDHATQGDRVDLFDDHSDQPKTNRAELGANDPDVFDMIMRGGKSAVPEFGNDDVAREFADAPKSQDGEHRGVGAWNPQDVEVIELAPEIYETGTFGELDTSLTDTLVNGYGQFQRDDWSDKHLPESGSSVATAAAVVTLPENEIEEVPLDQGLAGASEPAEPVGPMLQSLFPKVWAALAGIVGASHGPKVKEPGSDDQAGPRRR
jgi:Ca2+-binding RTX toxin-like protein